MPYFPQIPDSIKTFGRNYHLNNSENGTALESRELRIVSLIGLTASTAKNTPLLAGDYIFHDIFAFCIRVRCCLVNQRDFLKIQGTVWVLISIYCDRWHNCSRKKSSLLDLPLKIHTVKSRRVTVANDNFVVSNIIKLNHSSKICCHSIKPIKDLIP